MIDNLDLDSLKVDVSNLGRILSNPTPQALSTFLNQQGFQLPSSLFSSLSQGQLQSIIDQSKLSQFIKTKVPSLKDVLQKVDAASRPKKRVTVHWKYQLMSSVLLWKSLRPDIAPTLETVRYCLCSFYFQVVFI